LDERKILVTFLDGTVKNPVFFCRYFDNILMYLNMDHSFHGIELGGVLLRTWG
jgi:hypothetical protein